jgi:hypothetical protein
LLILLPDFDFGISVLTGGDMPVNMNFDFADATGGFLLPALDYATRMEAKANYEGDYVSSNPALNSSLTIVVDSEPGLAVTQWLSNGTDMATIAVRLQISSQGNVTPRVRLFPSGIETVNSDGTRKIAFKAIFEDSAGAPREGRIFSTDCATWLTASSQVWAARSLDEFVFTLDASGKAIAVEPVALRAPLAKKGPASPPATPPAEEPELPETERPGGPVEPEMPVAPNEPGDPEVPVAPERPSNAPSGIPTPTPTGAPPAGTAGTATGSSAAAAGTQPAVEKRETHDFPRSFEEANLVNPLRNRDVDERLGPLRHLLL